MLVRDRILCVPTANTDAYLSSPPCCSLLAVPVPFPASTFGESASPGMAAPVPVGDWPDKGGRRWRISILTGPFLVAPSPKQRKTDDGCLKEIKQKTHMNERLVA